ncbi:MAG: S41 family peptidase [Candidatus Gastranaerophilales bacterium]|nr:S41 family peptidase [Candidatus Gastranaerophilales bacterium]
MKNLFQKILLSLMLFGLFFITTTDNPVLAQSPQSLYDRAWSLINLKYVDQTNNNQDWQRWRHKYDDVIVTDEDAYVAIETMVSSLNDVYTRFLSPKEYQEESASIQGKLSGIGVQIGVRNGKLLIIAPLEDTPGERAGLKAEDEILEIDGKSTKGITVDAAADKIRGQEGTEVKLLVKRGDEPAKLYTITRANIELKSVSTKLPENIVIAPNIGYIRLSSFISRNAAIEFKQALDNNKDKDALIIDLRSNPGGLLTNATYIADYFLNSKVIVSTVDRDGYKETSYSSKNTLTQKPLAVLINEGSASASEILSGALKDNNRAVIIGKKSFGKGLVQEINRMPGGGAMHITIQKYLTPSGTDINKKGIEPNITVDYTKKDVENKIDPQVAKANEVLLQQLDEN